LRKRAISKAKIDILTVIEDYISTHAYDPNTALGFAVYKTGFITLIILITLGFLVAVAIPSIGLYYLIKAIIRYSRGETQTTDTRRRRRNRNEYILPYNLKEDDQDFLRGL
jgi:hypothetical protein